MVGRIGRVASAVSILILVAAGSIVHAQSDSTLPGPYQVQRVTREVDPRDAPHTLGRPRVMIDLGTAEGTPWPDRHRTTQMTLIGTEGVMPASLEDVVKVCETLCGDELEECHYEGLLVPAGTLAAIGTPVAAVSGTPALSDFVALGDVASERGRDTGALSDEYAHPIWPEENPGDLRHRFLRTGDAVTLEYAWGSSGEQSVPLRSCRFHGRGPVTRLACDAVEALLADGVPLLVSFPDYNRAGADLVASFVDAGQRYYVVRLALKAQTVYGLLYRDGDGNWQARFHPRNYSLLC